MPASAPAASTISLKTLTAAPRWERFQAVNRRRVLCVFPRYTHSFGTFDHAFPLMKVKGFMPPQGILVIAAYLPESWDVRLIDENIRPATDADFEWADVVFMSGMHVQRDNLLDINRRAHAHGKVTVLGGPSVSACPEWYGDIDLIQVGEVGDATHVLFGRLDRDIARPATQERYTTDERLPLDQFPSPAYHLIKLSDYFLGSIQFSSGCPYRCEFCDIPELYGRNPRLKTPPQLSAELDAMLARGNPGAVYFVDDNFIGNRKAALELLKELVRWQNERGFPLQFACEATLNIAQCPDVLELMKEAYFTTVFVGIETPEENALQFIQKKQNLRQPILEAIDVLNSYGMEVVSGIIIGLDTDTLETGERITQFIEASQIPLLTINILHALPMTPLWRRLESEGRLLSGEGRESNVDFLLPYEKVVEMWEKCVTAAYQPEAVYRRFDTQLTKTFPNRKVLPVTKARVNQEMILRGIRILSRIFWHVGVRSDYRRLFWKMALPQLRQLKIEEVIHIGSVAHHLIKYSRECASGRAEKSFYSPASVAAAARPEEPVAQERAKALTAV